MHITNNEHSVESGVASCGGAVVATGENAVLQVMNIMLQEVICYLHEYC